MNRTPDSPATQPGQPFTAAPGLKATGFADTIDVIEGLDLSHLKGRAERIAEVWASRAQVKALLAGRNLVNDDWGAKFLRNSLQALDAALLSEGEAVPDTALVLEGVTLTPEGRLPNEHRQSERHALAVALAKHVEEDH